MRVLCLILTLSVAAAFAETPWSNWGYTVTLSRQEGDLSVDRVMSGAGSEFEITHRSDLQSGDIDRINQMQGIFAKWKLIKARSVSYFVDGVKVDASITPDQVVLSNRDLKDNLPAGIAFSYIGALAYDFRLLQSNMFVRIQGVYNGEEALVKRIYEAAENPLAYVRRNDANYFADRLAKLEGEVVDLQMALKTNMAAETQRAIADLELARRGAFAFAVAASPKAYDPKLIDAVLAVKRADPKLSVKDALERVKKDGVKASEKEVAVIFALWFGDK